MQFTEDKCIKLRNILYFVILRIRLRYIKEFARSTGTSMKHIQLTWLKATFVGVFHHATATWYITVYILFYTMSFFNLLIMSVQFPGTEP